MTTAGVIFCLTSWTNPAFIISSSLTFSAKGDFEVFSAPGKSPFSGEFLFSPVTASPGSELPISTSLFPSIFTSFNDSWLNTISAELTFSNSVLLWFSRSSSSVSFFTWVFDMFAISDVWTFSEHISSDRKDFSSGRPILPLTRMSWESFSSGRLASPSTRTSWEGFFSDRSASPSTRTTRQGFSSASQ